MLFLTQHHITDRRKRGFEEANIYSEPAYARLQQANQIATEVEGEFIDVKLGDGIGLFEAQAIDECDTEEQRQAKRAKDEKLDWRRIESKHLNACHSSLSFFDTLGMRFHIPAVICCELRGEYQMGLDISLSDLDDWQRSKFSLLSPSQKAVIAKFLQFLAEDVDSEFSRPAIERDLAEFWMPPNIPTTMQNKKVQ